MPSSETVDAFVAMVTAGHFVEAMERFYAADATAQENLAPPRVGLAALITNEQRFLAAHESVRAECVPPVLIDGDHVAIRWRFILRTADGVESQLDEIAWQRWRGGKLQTEQFFYDPAQMRRIA